MFGLLRSLTQTSSSSVTSPKAQDPIIKHGMPFDRDNARWTPIKITVGNETCEIEAIFAAKDDNHTTSEIKSYPVKELNGMIAVTRLSSDQVILYIPFEKLQKQPPTSFSDFQNLVKSIMTTLQPGVEDQLQSTMLEEVPVPNHEFFALQVHFPSKSVYVVNPNNEKGSKIERGTEIKGSLVRAYATKEAIYLLRDTKADALTNPNTLAFLSSFKIVL